MWLIFALACAVCDAFAAYFLKQLMHKKLHPLSVSIFVHGIGFVIFFAMLLVIGKPLAINSDYLLLAILTALIAALAGIVILTSLKKADLSLVSPIQTLTPVIVLLLASVFLSETPRPLGVFGIFLVVMGGIILDKKPNEAFRALLRRIIHYQPALLAFFGAILFGVTSVLDKLALQTLDPLVWITYLYGLIFVLLLPFQIMKKPSLKAKKTGVVLFLIMCVIFSVLAIYFQMAAIKVGDVSYVMSIKRLSTVFAVVIAMVLIQERQAVHRLRGAMIMVSGAILIGLS